MMESINILQLQETESELIFTKLKNEAEQKKEEEFNKLLQQKEKDLVLAAELGKALLEKNEDLSQQNEKMAEDFAKQLEVRKLALKKLEIFFIQFLHKSGWPGRFTKKDFPGFLLIKIFVTLGISFTMEDDIKDKK